MYPLQEGQILKGQREATRYLRAYRAHLKREASSFMSTILSIEDRTLREAVAYVCEALAQDYANFSAESIKTLKDGTGQGITIANIDFDGELLDELERIFGGEKVEDAAHWILENLQGKSAIFVSWALGQILLDGKGTTAYEERILFGLRDRKFLAVFSRPDPLDPRGQRFHAR